MAGLSFLTILRKAAQSGKVPGSRDDRAWFRDQAQRVVAVNVDKLMLDPNAVTVMQPGKMYLFAYDPKWKEKLPYYDAFPLIFPFRVSGDRIWGVNVHFLPLPLRAQLMDALYSLVDNRFKNDNKKLRISYEILNSAAKFRAFKPCIRSYLSSQFRSKFLLIPYEQWEIAMFLPLARFKKKKQADVHRISKDMVT